MKFLVILPFLAPVASAMLCFSCLYVDPPYPEQEHDENATDVPPEHEYDPEEFRYDVFHAAFAHVDLITTAEGYQAEPEPDVNCLNDGKKGSMNKIVPIDCGDKKLCVTEMSDWTDDKGVRRIYVRRGCLYVPWHSWTDYDMNATAGKCIERCGWFGEDDSFAKTCFCDADKCNKDPVDFEGDGGKGGHGPGKDQASVVTPSIWQAATAVVMPAINIK